MLMRSLRLVALSLVAAALGGCAQSAKGTEPLDAMPAHLTLRVPTGSASEECRTVGLFTALADVSIDRSFADDFAGPRLDPGRWTMNYASDYNWVAGTRTLPGNKEQQIYVDPGYAGRAGAAGKPLGLDPFRFDKGVLSIVARRTPDALKPALSDYPYYSGAMTTAHTFQQRYGYFEARMRLPRGAALWPAFWLLKAGPSTWPPEIDVMEQLGKDPSRVYMTAHYRKDAAPGIGEAQCSAALSDATDTFRNYGVLIQPDRVTWYVDRQPVAQTAAKQGTDASFYMLVNLAVGGNWPGPVSDQTPAEAQLDVAHVTAYRLAEPK